MCLVIFTLGDGSKEAVLLRSIGILFVALNTVLIITVMSIFINSWAIVLHLSLYLTRNYIH